MKVENIDIRPTEIAAIRALSDFDLVMLLSELHDHGWPQTRKTLAIMLQQPCYDDNKQAQAVMKAAVARGWMPAPEEWAQRRTG